MIGKDLGSSSSLVGGTNEWNGTFGGCLGMATRGPMVFLFGRVQVVRTIDLLLLLGGASNPAVTLPLSMRQSSSNGMELHCIVKHLCALERARRISSGKKKEKTLSSVVLALLSIFNSFPFVCQWGNFLLLYLHGNIWNPGGSSATTMLRGEVTHIRFVVNVFSKHFMSKTRNWWMEDATFGFLVDR
jgi:hypothetical protein